MGLFNTILTLKDSIKLGVANGPILYNSLVYQWLSRAHIRFQRWAYHNGFFFSS